MSFILKNIFQLKSAFNIMTMGSKANYDLIIFGASGYTGQYVIGKKHALNKYD